MARNAHGFALRAAMHAGARLPFIDGSIATMRGGWRPTSDNAAIATRSWDALTRYGPVLGQPSRWGWPASGRLPSGSLRSW